MSKFLPLMSNIAFNRASTHQIGPPKEDSTYGMLGDRVVYCFS